MTDLVARLRASVRACRAIDRSELLKEAAAEIERLTLADDEREAVVWAAMVLAGQMVEPRRVAMARLLARLA